MGNKGGKSEDHTRGPSVEGTIDPSMEGTIGPSMEGVPPGLLPRIDLLVNRIVNEKLSTINSKLTNIENSCTCASTPAPVATTSSTFEPMPTPTPSSAPGVEQYTRF